MKIYCVEVKREFRDDDIVFHYELDHEPTRDEILEKIMNEDIGYNDKYEKFNFYEVFA